MAKRAPQVKPELLAMITQYQHDKGRDESLQETMLSRIPNRSFLPEVDKRKTLFVTGRGRKQTAAMIHDRLGALIEDATGISKALFELFPRVSEPLTITRGTEPHWERDFEWTAAVKVGVQDPTTQSLRFDQVAGSTASITTTWARLLGVDLFSYVMTLGGLLAAKEADLSRDGLYLCGPETSKRVSGRTLVVGVTEGFALYLPTRSVGNLYLRDYETQYREVHGKWTLKCTSLGTLYVDWSRIRVFQVEGIDTDPSVEIV
jgi:hypothetical protein